MVQQKIISLCIWNIFEDGELEKDSVVKKFLTTASDGKKYSVKGTGTISHKEALEKAHKEYDKYMQKHLTTAEQDYLEMLSKEALEIDK